MKSEKTARGIEEIINTEAARLSMVFLCGKHPTPMEDCLACERVEAFRSYGLAVAKAVVEECAKAADAQKQTWKHKTKCAYSDCFFVSVGNGAISATVTAIRALAAQGPGGATK